jgi:hypothetical protein
MRIDELIYKLEKLHKKHGNLEVYVSYFIIEVKVTEVEMYDEEASKLLPKRLLISC